MGLTDEEIAAIVDPGARGAARARRAVEQAVPILEDYLEGLVARGDGESADAAFVRHGLARYREVLA